MAHTMFDPRLSKTPDQYFSKYPALKDYPTIAAISSRMACFCWWYSCQASPLVVTPMANSKRAEAAVVKAGLQGRISEQEIQSLIQCQFSDEIRVAMQTFASFDVDNRTEAYLMAKDIFEGLKEASKKSNYISYEGEGKDRVERINSEEYLKIAEKVQKMLPDVIKQMESTYGIVEVDDSMLTLSADSLAETFFNSKKI